MYIHKLLPVVNSKLFFSNLFFNTFFITPILYLIFSILTLLAYQVLLTSLLKIINNVDSYSIVLNLT